MWLHSSEYPESAVNSSFLSFYLKITPRLIAFYELQIIRVTTNPGSEAKDAVNGISDFNNGLKSQKATEAQKLARII